MTRNQHVLVRFSDPEHTHTIYDMSEQTTDAGTL